jgi:CHAT domain-containing protein
VRGLAALTLLVSSLLFVYVPVFGQVDILLKQGDSLLQKPLYDSAYQQYRQALRESRSQKNTLGIIECLNRLATIDNIFSRTNLALEALHENSKLLAGKQGLKKQLAVCEEQLGRSYEDLGDIEESGRHTLRALNLRRELFGEKDARTAYAYMNLARYHSFRMANDSSYYYSKKAYTICLKHPERLHDIRYPELLLQHAYDSKNSKRIEDALREKHFENIRKLYRLALSETKRRYSMPSAEEAAAYQGLANTYNDQVRFLFGISRAQGQDCFDSANWYYDKSISVKKELYGDHHRSVSVSYYTKGLIYGNHPDLKIKLQAFGIYQKAMQAIVPGYDPTGPFSLPKGLKSSHPYQLGVVLKESYLLLRDLYGITQEEQYLLHAYSFASYRLDVWDEIVRRFESRESGSAIWIWGRTPFEDAVVTAYDMYATTKNKTYLDDMFTSAERGRNNDFAEQALRSSNFNDSMIERKGKDNTRYARVNRKWFVENVLDDNTAYLCFVSGKEAEADKDFILWMTKEHFEVKEIENSSIDDLVNTLEKSIQTMNADSFALASLGLYEKTLSSVLASFPRNIIRLILSLDGPYSRIPFEALLTGYLRQGPADFRYLPYLVRRYSINYTLSASHLSYVSEMPHKEKARISVFVPSFHTKSSLLFSEKVSKALAAVYRGDFHTGDYAGLAEFRKSIRQEGIVQLSTHAETDMNDPAKSVLMFSGKKQADTLYLNEILGMNLKNPLTIVSACESGKGKSVYGEGSKSFSRAFAFAGSRSVLSTLWKVDDKASALLIELFYKKLSTGADKPEALRKAKSDYINGCRTSEAACPFYWSGLVLSGDPRPLIPEIKTRWELVVYCGTGVLVVFCFLYLLRKKGKASLHKAA